MAPKRLTTRVGPIELRTPLVAASGTVGGVWEWAEVADVGCFGAAVAKSVAPEEWKGRPPPRLAPTEVGMLNGIGIQNPGIDSWVEEMTPHTADLRVPLWGSVVAVEAGGFAHVAERLTSARVAAMEVNLSCPNLEDGDLFSFSPTRSAEVVKAVVEATDLPVGAKLSPNTPDLVAVADACQTAGADFVVLTNTALGFGISVDERRPLLSGGIGGYSGPGLKPLALRCVYEVARSLPELPIIGCGGVGSGADVAEYLMAGASAVELGTVLLAEPKAGSRILDELSGLLGRLEVFSVADLIGSVDPW